MTFIAHRIILAYGWQRRFIAVVAGACGALALPPFDFFPAMMIPMSVSVWLIDGSVDERRMNRGHFGAIREAFGGGWWLGFGYFVAGLWWLGSAFLKEADQFAWALPLGVLGLPAVLALFPAAGFAMARIVWRPGPLRVVILAVALGITEWLRGHVLTGFPWNEFGMALGGNIVLAQIASLIGLYGLNLFAIAIFAAPATIVDMADSKPFLRRMLPTGVAAGVLLVIALFGAARLSIPVPPASPGVRLRIMQPNLDQDDKFRPDRKDEILGAYLSLSDRATAPDRSGIADATHLVWPESAFPFVLSRDQPALARIADALRANTILITGAARVEAAGRADLPGEMRVSYFNSVQVIGSAGRILDSVDKVHLVPFGEYLPLSGVLESFGLRHFVHIPGGFEPGDHRRRLNVPGLPAVAPLICYEAIFPGEVMPQSPLEDRPGLMLNVTNDSWFGRTPGPYQHFAQARLRSIEEGLPLVRAANTGISAVVDPYGRVIASLPLGVEGVLDAPLPEGLPAPPFARNPNLALMITLVCFGFVSSLTFIRRRDI